jgi:hypothetical protein
MERKGNRVNEKMKPTWKGKKSLMAHFLWWQFLLSRFFGSYNPIVNSLVTIKTFP